MPLAIRPAEPSDARPMTDLLNAIIAAGGTTAHRRPFAPDGVIDQFIAPRLGLSCFVATQSARILGFQALEWSDPDWPGDDRLPADWAIISTYVDRAAQRCGVGRALFIETAAAAKTAGVRFIDATIRRENAGGLAFYGGLGFTDYRESPATLSKRYAPL